MITGNDVSAKLKKQQEWEGLCLGERDVILLPGHWTME